MIVVLFVIVALAMLVLLPVSVAGTRKGGVGGTSSGLGASLLFGLILVGTPLALGLAHWTP